MGRPSPSTARPRKASPTCSIPGCPSGRTRAPGRSDSEIDVAGIAVGCQADGCRGVDISGNRAILALGFGRAVFRKHFAIASTTTATLAATAALAAFGIGSLCGLVRRCDLVVAAFGIVVLVFITGSCGIVGRVHR